MLKNIEVRVLYFIGALITSQGRKYDINEEASKLYGEDLHTVLQRFRRTPEYLKILNIKLTELLDTTEAIYHDAVVHYRNRLEEKLTKMFLPNSTQLRTFDNRNFNTFLGKKRKVPKLKSKKSQLINLDDYLKDRSYLTFEEKKRVQDLIYEHFGQALHEFIAGFSGEDSLPISTQLPNGGDQPISTTTEHDHVVTSERTETETESPETTAANHHHHHSTARPENDRNFRSPIN